MDDFAQFVNEHSLGDISILERVDEYALYCFYLGYEPEIGLKHLSPLRAAMNADDSSSFGIFTATRAPNREFMWKDHGTGKSGDIFQLVKLLFGYTQLEQVYRRIDTDFGLGLSNGTKPTGKVLPTPIRKYADPVDIRIKAKSWTHADLLYWINRTGNTKERFQHYQIQPVEMFWLAQDQIDPIVPYGLTFAYSVWSKYKIYRPFEHKDKKFRTNFTDKHIEGFNQLAYKSNTLIITKSTKDIVTLDTFGYEAVAARSENTVLPAEALAYFERKYKNILVLFDNDGKHSGGKYPYDKIFIPEESNTKDTSDHFLAHGHDRTGIMLRDIIGH